VQDYPLEVKLKIWINRGERQRLDREMQGANIWREQHTGTGTAHTDLGLNCYRQRHGTWLGLSCAGGAYRDSAYRAVNCRRRL